MALGIGKIKDLYKLQKEAKSMQKQMQSVIIDGESKAKDVIVRINGVSEIIDMDIDDELLTVEKKDKLIEKIKEAFADAQKKLQKEMMKDMDMDKMKSMLGM